MPEFVWNNNWITPVKSDDVNLFCSQNDGTTIIDQARWIRVLEQIRSYFLVIAPYLSLIVHNIFLKIPSSNLAVLVWDGSTVPALPVLTKFWAVRIASNLYPDVQITIPLPKATIYEMGQSVLNFIDIPWPGSENWYYYVEGEEPRLGTTFDPVKTFSVVRDTTNLILPLLITGLVLYLLNKLGLFSAVSAIIRSMIDIRIKRKTAKILSKLEKGVGDIDAAISLITNTEVLNKIKDLDSKIGLRLAFQ